MSHSQLRPTIWKRRERENEERMKRKDQKEREFQDHMQHQLFIR